MTGPVLLAGMQPWIPIPLLMLLLAAFVGFPLWVYARSGKATDVRLMWALVALRVIAVLILFLLLGRPMSTRTERQVELPGLAILIDNSQSMGTHDMPGGATRAVAVEAFFRRNEPLLKELRGNFDVKVFGFGGELAAEPGARHGATEEETGIGPALRTYWKRHRQGRVAATVLFSDGNHNSGIAPEDVARDYATGKVPIHGVLVGSEQPTRSMRDVALTDLVAPATVDLGNIFELTVELRALAAAGETVDLVCEFGGERIVKRRITVTTDRHEQRLRIEVPTEAKGTFGLVLRARPIAGEATLDNNIIRTEIAVTSRKVQVLLLEGVLRWETKFIRRSLAGDPGINLIVAYATDPEMRARLTRPEYRAQFDVFLIGDVEAGRVSPALQADLPGLISKRGEDASRGRGLALLGGWKALSGGGWGGSPLAALLPIDLAKQASRFEGDLLARPTRKGQSHFMLRFDDDERVNRRLWTQMPALLNCEIPARVKPTGTILLETPKLPVLVVSPYGLGRVAVLGTGSTWRWVMSESREAVKNHRLFWRQMVLWLAKRDTDDKGKMWLSLAPRKSLFRVAERVRLSVHVMDGKWRPDPRAETALVITAPDGKRIELTPKYLPTEQAFVLPFEPDQPGDYLVEAKAARGTDVIGKDKLTFKVRRRSPVELASPFTRPETLMALAQRTRGRMVDLGGAQALLRSLNGKSDPIVYTFEEHEDRWDSWWLLILFVAALGVEWTVRKMTGFV